MDHFVIFLCFFCLQEVAAEVLSYLVWGDHGPASMVLLLAIVISDFVAYELWLSRQRRRDRGRAS